MEFVYPPTGCSVPDYWFDPLRDALEQVRGDPEYGFVRSGDFTARSMILRARKADVVQYQHGPSGRYLYVDLYGRVCKFIAPKDPSRGVGRLVEWNIYPALDALAPATTRFDPPAALRPDGRPALRLLQGGVDA